MNPNDVRNHHWRIEDGQKYVVFPTKTCRRKVERHITSGSDQIIDFAKEVHDFMFGEFETRPTCKPIKNCKVKAAGHQFQREQVQTLHGVDGTASQGRWVFFRAEASKMNQDASEGELPHIYLIDFVYPKKENFDPCHSTFHSPAAYIQADPSEPRGQETPQVEFRNSLPAAVGQDNADIIRWMKSRVNFRLTDEQIDAIKQPAPLFINGQAGSGKSILLSFRLAEIYKKGESRPLFTAMSPSVIDQAQQDVEDYLEVHASTKALSDFKNDLTNQSLDSDWRNVPKIVFKSVQEIFLSLMKPEERQKFCSNTGDLKHEHNIGYGLFRNWFQSLVDADMTADFAWFGIRSIILGCASEYILASDSENEESKEKSSLGYVPKNRFKEQIGHDLFTDADVEKLYAIFDRYRSWKLSSGLFDDMDLAIAALRNSKTIQGTFSELYIDEAQDLTPLELNALMLLLKPDVRHHLILAGDPQQTINPTGFNWNSIREMIRQMVNVDVEKWKQHEIAKPFDITTNFRSTAEVVHIGNTVLKQSRFYRQETHVDQKPSGTNLGAKPLVIPLEVIDDEHLDELFFDPKLAENRQNIVLASDFVQMKKCIKDLAAGRMARSDEIDDHRFETIVQVKGREAPAVALFRPSWQVKEEDAPFFTKKADYDLRAGMNKATSVKIRFLFNQFYIAVTRAEHSLLIIEERHRIESILHPLFGKSVDVIDDKARAKAAIDAFLQHSRDNIDPLVSAEKNFAKFMDSGRDLMYLNWAISDANRAGDDHLRNQYLAIRHEHLASIEQENASEHRRQAAKYWEKNGNYWKAFIVYEQNSDWKRAWNALHLHGGGQSSGLLDPPHHRLIGVLAKDPSMIDTLWDEMAETKTQFSSVKKEWDQLPQVVQRPGIIDEAIATLIQRVDSMERVEISLLNVLPSLTSSQTKFVRNLNNRINHHPIDVDTERAVRLFSKMETSLHLYRELEGVLTTFIAAKEEVLSGSHNLGEKIAAMKHLCQVGEPREDELFLLYLEEEHEHRKSMSADYTMSFRNSLSSLNENSTMLTDLNITSLKSFDEFSVSSTTINGIFDYLACISDLGTPSDDHPSFWNAQRFHTVITGKAKQALNGHSDLLKNNGRGFQKLLELSGPEAPETGCQWVKKGNDTRLKEFCGTWQNMEQSEALGGVREKLAFHINVHYGTDDGLIERIELLLQLDMKDSYNALKSINAEDLGHWMKLFKMKKPTKKDLPELQQARDKLNRISVLTSLVQKLDQLISKIPRELNEVLEGLGKRRVDEVLNQVVRVKSASWEDVIEPIQSWPGYMNWVKQFSKRLVDRTSSDWETTMSSLQAWKAKLGATTDASFFRLICQFPEEPRADLTRFCLMLLRWEELGAADESEFIEMIRESQYNELEVAHTYEYLIPISSAINNEDIPHALRAAIYAHTIWYCNEFTLTASGGGKPTVDQMKQRIALFNPSKKMAAKPSREVAIREMDASISRDLPKENKDQLAVAFTELRGMLRNR